ncbi:hypothetical protein J2Y74_003276 [Pseudomonas migulae]|nr:hypothetical protein [Pseudomonas migulae]MCP1518966.1 hypothetical protein [Pseudomonas migulae]
MANIGVPVDPVEDGENDIAMLYAIPCRSRLAGDSVRPVNKQVG